MRVLKMYPTSINERFIDEAVNILRNGGLIVYPTDSVYGIGCDALNNRAIENICRIKNIDPRKQHLAIICADLSQASEYARIDNRAFGIMRRNLPGPFTFILPASTKLPKVFKGRREVGIRVPDNAIVCRLAEALGNPILNTTANWDEAENDITIPEAIATHYKSLGIEAMIDAGEGGCQPTAVIDLIDSSDPQVLREGIKPLN